MRHAAHDLGSFITVANGYRQRAEEALEKANKYLARARVADQQAIQLVRGILTGSPGNFDINVVAAELVDAVASLGGSLRVECGKCLPFLVTGDALKMHRALFNLCLNARNAGATNIKIKTGLLAGGTAVLVTVEDNGKGFPGSGLSESLMARPSESIWNLPVSADGLHGHGLAIVKKTIEEHNGSVEVWSQPGETVFKIWLPIAASALGTAIA